MVGSFRNTYMYYVCRKLLTKKRDMQKFFDDVWSQQDSDELKRDRFFEFMEPKVKEASVDDSLFVMTGLAAPAAAVIGKRASGHIPYVKNMRLDLGPNVVFVPVFTLGAIVVVTAAQMSRKSATAEQNKDEEPKNI
jgi:hypothetical protein